MIQALIAGTDAWNCGQFTELFCVLYSPTFIILYYTFNNQNVKKPQTLHEGKSFVFVYFDSVCA